MRRHSDSELTSAKRGINIAFRNLRSQGFLARQGFMCCMGCACSALAQKLDQLPGKYKGVAYYHRQDLERFQEYGVLYLRYSGVSGGATAEEVGIAIGAALSAVGLRWSWRGDPNEAIEVRASEVL